MDGGNALLAAFTIELIGKNMDTTAQAIADLLTQLPPEPETEPATAETAPTPSKPENPGLVFPHQQEIFRELITTARAFGKENWFSLPVLPRWHTLLVGPTGNGKSHLVRALGKFLGWPLLTVWSTRWIVAGGRGKETCHEIARWLSKQDGKCLIFVDEADKLLNETNDTSLWGTHMRAEMFQFLDRDLPAEIEISDPESEVSSLALWAKAQMNLRCNALIVAAGAFQGLWDYRPRSLGFSAETTFAENTPSPHEMKTVLPPELINRFGKILSLPPLREQDYVTMIRRTAQALPGELREKFIKNAEKNLPEAIRDGRGVRYVEECVTQALLDEAAAKPMQTSVSTKSVSP
jgi:SpoVK/Ycf46/Vps4 family AAA+-type ATPase